MAKELSDIPASEVVVGSEGEAGAPAAEEPKPTETESTPAAGDEVGEAPAKDAGQEAGEAAVKQATSAAPEAPEAEPMTREGMHWYVLRVASNKEGQVQIALDRKVKIEGLESQIGRILVPTVKEKRMKAGQARVFERKLYPGYVFVEMATEQDGSVPEDIWFMIKETTGVGDFIGSDGKPIKMGDHDVAAMLDVALKSEEDVGLSGLDLHKGDLAKVTEGSFENFEGVVDSVDEHRGMVTVLLTIFGRSTPVEVEYWQLEKL